MLNLNPRRICMLTLISLVIGITNSKAHAIVLHNEALSGDLSSVSTAPTNLGVLFADSYNIIGGTIGTPIDRDFWSVTIPANHMLSSVTLAAFTNTDNRSFFAIVSGGALSAINDANLLLGGSFVGDVPGRLVGDNLLDDLGARVHIGGTPRFSGPLGPGTYTFWSQENTANSVVTYNYQLNVTSSVPEPASIAAFSLILGYVASRRRRRNNVTTTAQAS